MKLTLFGLTLTSSWGNGHATPYRALLRALHRRGHHIVFYEKDVDYYAWRRDFKNCDYCDLVLYRAWDEVRARALRNAADSDVVMTASYVPEGARIADEILNLAGPLKVFYDLDTPITLDNLARGDLDYLRRDQLPEFDLVLSFTGGGILDELQQCWGARRVRPLYGCVDPEAHRRARLRGEFRCDLSYMGTHAPDRQEMLDKLFLKPARRLAEARFVLAGSLYPWEWSWPENVRRIEHVAPRDHPALYSSSRMTLNLTRAGMARYGYCPSGRFFEAAACGTPLISDWWEGLDSFFVPEQELMVARDGEDVVGAIESSDAELKRMARRARERALSEHTGERRAEQLLAYFEEARQGSWRAGEASARAAS